MNVALILAGGIGSRMGLDIPKQFYKINNKEVLAYSLEAFEKTKLIEKIIVVSDLAYKGKIEEIKEKYNISKLCNIVKNGDKREDSSYNGLKYIKSEFGLKCNVLIHDSARCLINIKDIENLILASKNNKGISATLAREVTDTVVMSKDFFIDKYINRASTYLIETPQMFKLDLILKAHENRILKNLENVTDDTSLVRNLNEDVLIVKSNYKNYKLTRKEDIVYFEYYLKNLK